MKGHEKLIAMRKAGKRPVIVFLNDFPCKTDWFETGDKHVTVCIHGDSIERSDLRFLTGCMVSATGATENRAKALLEACKRVNAKVVGACEARKSFRDPPGWCEVWRNPKFTEVGNG